MRTLSLATACLVLLPTCLVAQQPERGARHPADEKPDKDAAKHEDEAAPTPKRWQTHHSITIDGKDVQYDAVVSSIVLKDDEQKPTAEIGYTAYFRTGVAEDTPRPILFAYNGGPGSASFWLHMGVMGPKRVPTPGTEHAAPAPYEIVDNAATVLDVTDLVMVDPVGTGFSHPLGDTKGKAFWGVDEDARSIAQFVRRFLSQHNRWNSPKYLLGESYGTTRSAVLASVLQDDNIDLNGIVLVSAVLDFRTLLFAPGDDLPYIVSLPTYAAVAWHHEVLPDRPAELRPFLDEVEHFATHDYATALLQGNALSGDQRDHILDALHRYTGLGRDYLDRADLRVTASEFEKELLRSKGEVVGRLDARFLGPSGDLLAQHPSQDPQSSAISAAYAGAWNTYLRSDLGYDGDREYVASGDVGPWNWEHGRGHGFGSGALNVGPDLARALQHNPRLQVLLLSGLYDLATPYFAADWTMDHLGLAAELRDNIHRETFEGGHMMYVNDGVLPKWRRVLADFIGRTSGSGKTETASAPAASAVEK